ncbi:putative periplasmic ligand-binding sensor protein [Fibrella aestuarina BUZ 2]|uniref:Putative periplasmic ligand-binding sensor protein n=1 Tax=Fibrella aestuarina BUZ 2 TaxID=1166018 RepID=I0K2D3_9BACT|nr:triple tyrosine motif-containing protein [Fibrella aestuarina]CCG98286.1 putative periplasmic ligand-binding sensor protein [Fibrella aestuarina BUZ 2]
MRHVLFRLSVGNRWLLLLAALHLAGPLRSQQPIASPQISHHSSSDYKAGTQNWTIRQDRQGILYIGNNEGLLTYNGRYWNTYRLPNQTVVRSIGIDAQHRIFVGGQDEIGYFFPNANGVLTYHSLLPLLAPADRSFADVWTTEVVGDDVFFRSVRQVMHFHAGKLDVYRSSNTWAFLGQAGGYVYAQDQGRGLLRFTRGRWQPLVDAASLTNISLSGLLPYGADTLLVTTLKHGLFLLHQRQFVRRPTALDPALFSERIYCAAQLAPNQYALGTTSAGVLIIDKAGRVVQAFTSPKELQNANVRGILLDQQRNLWLALDDGLDFVAINSPIRYIRPDGGRNATGYAMAIHGQHLFAGTSNGLYVCPVAQPTGDISQRQGDFREVPGTKGQVWRLDRLGNQLLMSHETGLFDVQPQQATPIYTKLGTWLVKPVSATGLLAGTYHGLRALSKNGDIVRDLGTTGDTPESLRFLLVDTVANQAWASHPNRGLFRMALIPGTTTVRSTRLYTDRDGLPSVQYNYLFRLRNRLFVGTQKGVYEYDARQDRFVPSPLLTPLLGTLTVQYLVEDQEQNIWFASQKRMGVIDFGGASSQRRPQVVFFPELTGRLIGGFEFIYPFNRTNIFISSNKGFLHLNYDHYRARVHRPTVLLSKVTTLGAKDSLVFGGYVLRRPSQSTPTLSPDRRSLRFEFASTLFDQATNVEFSYRLEGSEGNWSSWSTKSEKEYTNLPWGHYTFSVKARNNLGNESGVQRYSFYIQPAWYESYWARLCYVLLAAGGLYQLFKWQRRHHRAEQAQLTYLHQLELDRNEKEIVRLKNQQLEADMDFKNRELATMTMQLAQRGDALIKVKEVVSTMAKKQDNKDNALNFRQVLRLIRDVESKDADWGQFTLHFNTVNDAFFRTLKENHPDLTPNDLKLCAFLKMNLSSKEIAQFMNITVKAVEIGRYRLRKKLGLSPTTNLYEFLTDVAKQSATGGLR